MIIFDLEWNSGCDEEILNEILQIGAVRINQLGGKITDTFCVYIRPFVHKKYSLAAKALPELQASIESLVDLPSAIASFIQWCGEETEFAGWGPSDLKVLQQNIDYWNLGYSLPVNLYDLQAAFSAFLYIKANFALHKAVDYCKIPATFDFHTALHDAVYTAVVGEVISADLLSKVTQPRNEEKVQKNAVLGMPRKKASQYGPFETMENVLNSRDSRHPPCPLCGKIVGISYWFFANSQHYYSQFSCPDHGKFIYHLEPSLDQNSRWWGKLSVLEACKENISSYRSVKRAKRFRCKQSNHSSRRSKSSS